MPRKDDTWGIGVPHNSRLPWALANRKLHSICTDGFQVRWRFYRELKEEKEEKEEERERIEKKEKKEIEKGKEEEEGEEEGKQEVEWIDVSVDPEKGSK